MSRKVYGVFLYGSFRVMKRRIFMSAVGTSLATASFEMFAKSTTERSKRPLRLLVLGGTRFIGLHMAELALARGHTLTFFNRGRTNTDRFPEVERLFGDRNGDLKSLAGRDWDAVIDNSGYVPRHIREAAQLLEPRVRRYLFISSVSVYESFAQANDETSASGKMDDESIEKVDGATYGPLKAASERAARAVFGESRTSVIRPGLIVGPDDNTDRFTYWPARASRGGRMIAPNDPRDPVQFIDVRDLAAFTLRLIEHDIGGVFNALSPPGKFTIGNLIDESISTAKRIARPADPPVAEWVRTVDLGEQKISAWSDMPVWAPPEGESVGFAATSAERALRAGLTIRGLRGTVGDTLKWHLARPESERKNLKAGLSPEREAAAFAAIDKKKPS